MLDLDMAARKSSSESKPRLLSGGNPQIPMGYGGKPVRAYLAAMPGWKQPVGEHLHHLITTAAPQVRQAVKWNSPFYGVQDRGWVLALHCLTTYVQVTFFNGSSLEPMPPVPSKDRNVRYLNVHEGEQIDDELFTSWVKQATALPGWMTADIRTNK